MDIIKYFYSEPDFKRYIRDRGGVHWEDFYQDCYFILTKLNPEKVNQAIQNGKLKPFIIAILQNQLISNKSDFFKTYIRQADSKGYNYEQECEFEYDNSIDEKFEKVTDILNQPKNLTEHMQNKIMEHYINTGSYNKCHIALNKVVSKDIIRDNIEQCRERIINQIKKKDI